MNRPPVQNEPSVRRSILLKLHPRMKLSPFDHDLTAEIRRRQARRHARLPRILALYGIVGLCVLSGRALAALAVQDAHSVWLLIPSLIALLWGAWSIYHLLTH